MSHGRHLINSTHLIKYNARVVLAFSLFAGVKTKIGYGHANMQLAITLPLN